MTETEIGRTARDEDAGLLVPIKQRCEINYGIHLEVVSSCFCRPMPVRARRSPRVAGVRAAGRIC